MDRYQQEIINNMKWEEPETPLWMTDEYLELEMMDLERQQEERQRLMINPTPVLTIDNQDFLERGIMNPTLEEVEQVVSYLQQYFLDTGEFDKALSEALDEVQSRRLLTYRETNV